MHEVDDAAISIQETTNDRKQELIGDVDATKRQALRRCQADGQEPAIQLDVAERGAIADAARPGLSRSVADRPTDALEERLDQLCIFGVENEMPAIAGQIAIGGSEPYGIRKAIGPDDRSRPIERSTAATQAIGTPDPDAQIPRAV